MNQLEGSVERVEGPRIRNQSLHGRTSLRSLEDEWVLSEEWLLGGVTRFWEADERVDIS